VRAFSAQKFRGVLAQSPVLHRWDESRGEGRDSVRKPGRRRVGLAAGVGNALVAEKGGGIEERRDRRLTMPHFSL